MRWETGGEFSYRIGKDDAYDLAIAGGDAVKVGRNASGHAVVLLEYTVGSLCRDLIPSPSSSFASLLLLSPLSTRLPMSGLA